MRALKDNADKAWFRRAVASRRRSAAPLPALSKVADRGLIWPIAAAGLGLVPTTRPAAVAGLASVAGTTALTGALQQLVRRDRPPRLAALVSRGSLRRPSSPSFPSAHASNAAAFGVAVTMVKPGLGLAFGPLVGLVSFARVGIGHHFPSDVAAGVVLGASFGAGFGMLIRRRAERDPRQKGIEPDRTWQKPGAQMAST